MEKDNIYRELIENSGIINYPTDSNMLIDYIFNRVDFLIERIKGNISINNWNSKKGELLHRLSRCIGVNNLPEKTKLKTLTVGTIERDDYYLEKVIFESFKNISVPSHLYIPKKYDKPCPAILHIPGHWMENSTMQPDLQKCCIGLVKLGFVVLNIDPLEQGERRFGWKNHGHLEALLLGITQIGLMIYENMKAIDFLQSREEIDEDKIGMTGTSGGGFNTIYTSPFEKRIKALAPICYATTYPGLFKGIKWYNWNGGTDLCNQIPNIVNTLTFSNLLALDAPRPVLLVNAMEDLNFPLDTAIKVYEEAKPFFDIDNSDISQVLVNGGHGEGKDAREAIYGFFTNHLMNKGDGLPITEPDIKIEKSPYEIDYIDATAEKNSAQTFHPKKNLETYVFHSDKLKEIKKPLKEILLGKLKDKYTAFPIPETLEEWKKEQKKYKSILNNTLVETVNHNSLNPRIESGIVIPDYFLERVVFDSENGISIPGLLFLPDNWITPNNIWICLDDHGKNKFIKSPFFWELIKKKQAIFTIDLRGQGESLAIEFEVATMCYMIDRDLFSQRVFDVLRAVEYISLRASTGIQLNKQNIICYGRGISALTSLFAGAIDNRIAGVFSENQLYSFIDLLNGDSRFSSSIYLYDILSKFDIPEVASLIFPKPLVILNPVDRKNKMIARKKILDSFHHAKVTYERFGNKSKLILQHSIENLYSELIMKFL